MTTSVEVVEVSLRDGLQNEATTVGTESKIRIAGLLADAGAGRIEAVSFVHPRAVPAMADAEPVMAGIDRRPGVSYSRLVLNVRGMERALRARVDEVNVVVCASETFSRRNQNMSVAESVDVATRVVRMARDAGIPATVTVATAFGCPFEGYHFHDTRNTGIANAWAAIGIGADALDSSAAGIGGCPFAPAATGNIATEDLIYLLTGSGIGHGLALPEIVGAGRELCALLGRASTSTLARAGDFPAVTR